MVSTNRSGIRFIHANIYYPFDLGRDNNLLWKINTTGGDVIDVPS